MKAIVVSKWFPTPYHPGSGVFVLEQIKALRRLGVEVVLVIAPTPWAPRWLRFLPRVRKYKGIPFRSEQERFKVEHPRVLNLPGDRLFFLYGLFFYLRCRRVIRKLLKEESADLIHAHTIMPDGFAAVLLGREFRLPVICTLHGGDINDLLPPFSYPGKKRLALAATKWALKKIRYLMAVSHDLRRKVATLTGGRRTDIEVAHNGADTNTFKPIAKPEARDALGLPPDKPIVLFVGGLVGDKGLPFLLQAFSRVRQPGARLYLVGSGRKEQELRTLACNLGIQEACVFAGRRPHDQIPLWLSAADCLVLSSVTEGSPTILSEAMICRAPIVATSVGGIPELIRNGETGLVVQSKDPSGLARAIELMLTDRAAAERMARTAEIHARANLTWDANARKTLEIYRTALSQANEFGCAAGGDYLENR